MMTFLLAAAAAAAQPVPASDPDLRCLAAYLIVAGNAGDDAKVTAEDKAGIQSIVMYFLGKVDSRHAGADLERTIRQVIQTPNYGTSINADVERCGAEVEARGKYLQSFGKEPETASPKP